MREFAEILWSSEDIMGILSWQWGCYLCRSATGSSEMDRLVDNDYVVTTGCDVPLTAGLRSVYYPFVENLSEMGHSCLVQVSTPHSPFLLRVTEMIRLRINRSSYTLI